MEEKTGGRFIPTLADEAMRWWWCKCVTEDYLIAAKQVFAYSLIRSLHYKSTAQSINQSERSDSAQDAREGET